VLTRFYVDNFRCFVNFEYRPARRQLILGRNGSGKSSLLDALLFVRQFVCRGDRIGPYPLVEKTRWQDRPEQTFEIEARLDDAVYVYRLVLGWLGDPREARVESEWLRRDGKSILEFEAGEVRLFDDRGRHKVTYPLAWNRSAIGTTQPSDDLANLARFDRWLANLLCFRINPFAMKLLADDENAAPNVDLANFAAWYRHLVQAYQKQNADFLDSLQSALDGFRFLGLMPFDAKARILTAEFGDDGMRLDFRQLSDGQRCLISLYAILHFVLAAGCTVILDEPDNFVALREIQPWLIAATDMVDSGRGQLIIISHHPEILNQWAPETGVEFVRDGAGPVRVMEFRGDPQSRLSPAELVARGWER
jgi:predicted ATPase